MRSFNSLFPKRQESGMSSVAVVGPIELFQVKSDTFELSDYNAFSNYVIEADFADVVRVGKTVTVIPNRNAPVGPSVIRIIRDGISRTITLPVTASYLLKPVINSPLTGSNDIALRPTITIAQLSTSSPIGLGIHNTTQWEISTDTTFTNLVATQTTSAGNRLTFTPNVDLPANAQVYIRARAISILLGVSEWSNVISARTAGITTPIVTDLSGGTYSSGRVTLGFTANSSSYTGVGTHSASQWQLLDAQGVVVNTSAELTGIQLRSYSPNAGGSGFNFIRGASYFIRVRYKSNGGIWSNYSPSYQLTIALQVNTSYEVCNQTTVQRPVYGESICTWGPEEDRGHPDAATESGPCADGPSDPSWGLYSSYQPIVRQSQVNTTICYQASDNYEY